MFLNVILGLRVSVNEGNHEPEIGMIIAIILINIIFIVVVALFIRWFTKPKLYPITVIKDENNKIVFAVYQQKNVYKVVNQVQPKFQPATFYNWEDVVSFIKNETKDWDIEVDFLKK